MHRLFRLVAHAAFVIIALAGAGWTATALWLHLTGPARIAALAALAVLALAAIGARFTLTRRSGWALLIAGALASAGWYQTLTPRQDRDWAPDLAHQVIARVQGDLVTLEDMRDFDWRSRSEAEQRWTSRSYDLRKLDGVQMITSSWESPDIAHMMVRFGFTDGRDVVFSVEARREADESYSAFAGLFRQFENILIASSSEDIVKLRTDYRRENVRFFPVELTAEQQRALFLSYVALAQRLEQEPEFYNTVTANCTTTVWRQALEIDPELPMDWRLILSGHLPEYLAELGVLGPVADPAPH